MSQMCGGLGAGKEPTEELKSIVKNLWEDIQTATGINSAEFTVVKYRSQVVAGTNYFVKVRVGGTDEYIHLRIYEPLPHTGENPSLAAHEVGKSEDDEIVYFG